MPEEFTQQEFIDLGVEVHTACEVQLEECACFRERYEYGQPDLNLLQQGLPVARHSLSYRLRLDRRGAGPCWCFALGKPNPNFGNTITHHFKPCPNFSNTK